MECYLHNPILEHEEPVDEGILLMLKVSGICSACSIKKKDDLFVHKSVI